MSRIPTPATARSGRTLLLGLVLILLTLAAVGLMWMLQRPPSSPAPTSLPRVIGHVTPFTLTNQAGGRVTLSDLAGKVWVADIIFTRCAGPCPRMTQQMRELQTRFAGNPDVRLVSLTTDPAYDTPEILKRYGDKFGAQSDRWWFLTGTTTEIATLARYG
jgi:protein SCO1/2